MKRIPAFLTTCCLFPLAFVLVLTPAPPARAASAAGGGPVSVNFFVDQLKDQGAWFSTPEYGDVWQPYIAYKNDSWRPYTDGYWTYTDGGWMFVSYESFGWAVYHYGRWTHLKDVGWAWVPGTEWAPAWVTWRSSDPNGPATPPGTANIAATSTDAPSAPPVGNPPPSGNAPADNGGPGPDGGYIGWAPLPPDAVYNDGYDFGPTVDVDFGIDPYDYCFVGIGNFGAPWIGGVLFGPDRGYYCCEHSENITHLYYSREGAYRGVYAGGPNYDRLRGRTAQPIAQLRIDRQGARAAGPLDRINGREARVFAPRFSRNGVAANGRVQFNREPALAHADVLPGGQRGGGPNAQAQNSALEAFARQGQEFRQRNPRTGAGGVGRGGSVLATPDGVRSAPEAANAPRTAASAPQKAARSVARSGSSRRSRGGGSRGGGGQHARSSGGGGHRGGGSHGGGHSSGHGGGHGGGGHGGGGHGGGGHGGGGKKR